jgi:DNA-directed RNA polymerase subunit omega
MLPSPDILNNYEHGKFVLANLAAKRAKQLREGAPPLVNVESNHPLTIALAEIAAGKIKAILPNIDDLATIEAPEITITDDVLPAEFGMLLPALDETEVALIDTSVLGDEESEVEAEVDPDALSLSDLVGEEEEEVVAPVGDEDTLSLTDIAEQETSIDEEESEV